MNQLQLAQRRREAKLLDDHIERQLDLLLSAKDVGPEARRKLRPLLKHYAKKAHPFRACVRDNRKRFGPRAEAICATLKDIIRGTTKWRGKGNKRDKGVAKGILSNDEVVDLLLSIPDAELEQIYNAELELQAYGSAAPAPMEEAEDEFPAEANHRPAEDPATSCANCSNFDADEGFCMLYGAPTSGEMTSEGFQASGAEMSAAFEHEEGKVVLGQFFLERTDVLDLAEAEDDEQQDEGIWKTILRTGTWKTRPGPGGTVLRKPLHVTLDATKRKGHVSLKKLVEAFEDRAVEHVTIPLSHKDAVNENTGQVKQLRIVEEGDGNARLEALHEFTDPDVKAKVLNRSILNTSCGILFDHVRRKDGKKYDQALDHVSLTNKPWIDGLPPFGEKIAASNEGTEVERVLLATPEETHDDGGGGEAMGENNGENGSALEELTGRLGLSIEEIEDRITRSEEMERKLQVRDVNDRAKAWVGEGVPPAVVETAKAIMLDDDGGPALLLSQEEGEPERLTASDIVERIVAKVPRLKLSSERQQDDERPKDDADEENLPQKVKTRAAELTLENVNLSDDEAIRMAREELGTAVTT